MSARQFYQFGPFRIDTLKRVLAREGEPVPLNPKAFDILVTLVEGSDRIVEKEDLMKKIWPHAFVEEGNLTQNIHLLRKALGDDPNDHRYIVTIPGRGYRFVAPVNDNPGEENAPSWEFSEGKEGRQRFATTAERSVEKLSKSRIVVEEEYEDGPAVVKSAARELSDGQEVSFHYPAGRSVSAEEVRPTNSSSFSGSLFSTAASKRKVTVSLIRVLGVTLIGSVLMVGMTAAVLFWISGKSNHKAVGKAPAVNHEAYEAYLKGRFFWNKRTSEGLFKSISYFKQAIEKGPDFALGYAGLADAYAFDLEHWPKAEAAAKKAIEIDGTLAEPHASLAFIRMFWQWNWADAEREFKRAFDLNPNYATAHQWYATYLMAKLRGAEAKAEMRQALELDPSSLPINADMGQMFYFAHEYDQAIAACQKVLNIDADFINAHVYLHQAYTQKGMYAQALDEYFKVERLAGGNPRANPTTEEKLRKAYATDGVRGFWRGRIDLLKLKGYYPDAYAIAEYYALLGEKDQALYWLGEACKNHALSFIFVGVNPAFDDLHRDRRFLDLVRRLGIPLPAHLG